MNHPWKIYIDELTEPQRREMLDNAIERLMEIEEVRFMPADIKPADASPLSMGDEFIPARLYWQSSGESLFDDETGVASC